MGQVWGVPQLLLTDVVANFNIETGNVNQNHYLANLTRAQRTVEDLLRGTIWATKYKAVPVKKDLTVTMPSDMDLFINISIEDVCGKLVGLGYNSDINTVDIPCPVVQCSCTACEGNGTYCLSMDAIQVELETVMLNGFPFTKRTWIQKGANGLIQKVIEVPYPDQQNYDPGVVPTVHTVTEYETLCTVAVNETNCIQKTEANFKMLNDYCGCKNIEWQKKICCDTHMSDYVEWNWKANCPNVIQLKDCKAKFVIVAYHSSGNCNASEIMIPRPALDAVQYGIVYRQKAWSSGSIAEKKAARRDYDEETDRLFKWLHPLNIEDMKQLESIVPIWG